MAAVIAIPALVMGLSPTFPARRREKWRAVGPVRDFEDVVVLRQVETDPQVWPRSFRKQAVFVCLQSEQLRVLSRTCTDLGCPLTFDPGSTCFYCPCHGGIFAGDGSRLAGPPNGPMHQYAHRVRDGVLEIDLSSVPPSA